MNDSSARHTLLVKQASEVSILAARPPRGARQTHVVRDDGVDVGLPGQDGHGFFLRRAAASLRLSWTR